MRNKGLITFLVVLFIISILFRTSISRTLIALSDSLLASLIEFGSSQPTDEVTTPAQPAIDWASIITRQTEYRFAVIGDFGTDSTREARVAALMAGWNPDFVITTGDNNYPRGGANTIDENIGKYYGQFIGNYRGRYGNGSPINRFWPSLGNHDWRSIICDGSNCRGPHQDYFTLPGNERYYDVDYGLVHLFAVDSDEREPNGNGATSNQAKWLQDSLADSDSCFDVVYFHHAPYSSGRHGSDENMQWPFAGWGAEIVLSGHEHSYERLDVRGAPYIVNGAGGNNLYSFANAGELPSGVTSMARYNDDVGAMLITVTDSRLLSQFFNAGGDLIDEFIIEKTCENAPLATPLP